MGSTHTHPPRTKRDSMDEPPIAFREPWRKVSWRHNQEDVDYVNKYKPKLGVNHLRVLLYGPVGAGKSSFISSVSSTLVGEMTIPAGVSSTASDQSHTRKYETYKIQKGARGNIYPVVFNDIMGLEEQTDGGVRVDDIKLALMGHVKEGYEFNPSSSLSSGDSNYNPSPSPDDKVHVLVCVHSANAAEINASTVQKMKEIRAAASDLGIPQLAVGTKVDEACGETEKDLKNVYKSKYIKKKMQDFSSALGIPLNCIFPVKNYSEEASINDDVDTLILSVLRMIIDVGDDYIYNMFYKKTPPPSTTFREPWRKVSWRNNQNDLDYVNKYNPKGDEVKHLMLYGPVGSGKSSFICSISSTLAGVTGATSDQSHSRKYETYKIQKGARGNVYPVVFNDVMGLKETDGGVRVDDIKLVMEGHVKEGYKLQQMFLSDVGVPLKNYSEDATDDVMLKLSCCSTGTLTHHLTSTCCFGGAVVLVELL